MLKYFKYFLPTITGLAYIYIIGKGEYYPTFFLIGFSLLIIVGDYVMPRDKKIQHFSYPEILNLSLYINFPILLTIVLITISFLSTDKPTWIIDVFQTYIYSDFVEAETHFNIID